MLKCSSLFPGILIFCGVPIRRTSSHTMLQAKGVCLRLAIRPTRAEREDKKNCLLTHGSLYPIFQLFIIYYEEPNSQSFLTVTSWVCSTYNKLNVKKLLIIFPFGWRQKLVALLLVVFLNNVHFDLRPSHNFTYHLFIWTHLSLAVGRTCVTHNNPVYDFAYHESP